MPGTRVPIVAGQRCPRCSAHTLYRSQLRSFSERIRKKLTEKRLYRCEGCGWRGWTQNLDAALVHTLSQPEKGSARTGRLALDAVDHKVHKTGAKKRAS